MNEFVYNVVYTAAKTIKKLKLEGDLKNYNVVIVSNEHEISYLLCGTLSILKKNIPNLIIHFILNQEQEPSDMLAQVKELWPDILIWDSINAYFENNSNGTSGECPELFFDFANLRHPMYADSRKRIQKEAEICQILEHNLKKQNNLFQLITCIPGIDKPLPDVTNAIAEREYEVIFRDYPEDSLEKYVIHLEDVCRSYEKIIGNLQVIRLDRVFGPGITSKDEIWVIDVLNDMFINKKVTVHDRDRHDYSSASYVRDALVSILVCILSGRKGNIYHVSTWELTRSQIISTLYDAFPEYDCVIEAKNDGWSGTKPVEYRILNARKVRLAHSSNLANVLYTTKRDALKCTALWFKSRENYIQKSEINLYYGRMDRIRELELEILKEVDSICKENDIHYFLAAGTMLGAVRHHGFIPWDDDVDIGMLPEDYEKFIKVCPNHLSTDYGYQSFSTELTSHYIHDKIRLKNSFFSTKYSDKYSMLNGVYIDVFVYFKTADRPFFQNMHIKHINAVRRLIGIRWADRPRKNMHYYFSVVALPVMRLFPFLCLHKYYMHVMARYEKRNTHYRVDSMGFNLKKVKAFPDEWLHGTIDADFCGYKFPILAHYDEYLRHWYGEHYMELLPVSERKSVHSVVRIDLGQNLFDETKHNPMFRDVDLRGELYEKFD